MIALQRKLSKLKRSNSCSGTSPAKRSIGVIISRLIVRLQSGGHGGGGLSGGIAAIAVVAVAGGAEGGLARVGVGIARGAHRGGGRRRGRRRGRRCVRAVGGVVAVTGAGPIRRLGALHQGPGGQRATATAPTAATAAEAAETPVDGVALLRGAVAVGADAQGEETDHKEHQQTDGDGDGLPAEDAVPGTATTALPKGVRPVAERVLVDAHHLQADLHLAGVVAPVLVVVHVLQCFP